MKFKDIFFVTLSIVFNIYLSSTAQSKIEIFKTNNKWFFVDSNFIKIDKSKYDSISLKYSSFYVVRKRNRYALFNEFGKPITKFKYQNLYPVYLDDYSQWIMTTKRKKNLYKIDEQGSELIYIPQPFRMRCGGPYSMNSSFVAWRLKTGGYRIIPDLIINNRIPKDSQGVFKPYQEFCDNTNGTAFVKENNQWILINKKFEQVMPDIFDSVIHRQLIYGHLVKHDAIVYKNGYCGYFDINTRLIDSISYKKIIPVNFEYIWAIESKQKQGWIRILDNKKLFN